MVVIYVITSILIFAWPALTAFKDVFMWIDCEKHGINKQASTVWHAIDAAMNVSFAYVAAIVMAGDVSVKAVLFFIGILSWTWFLGDILLNIYGLERPWHYVGNTAKTDKLIRAIFGQNTQFAAILKLALSVFCFMYGINL